MPETDAVVQNIKYPASVPAIVDNNDSTVGC